jgi:hypothetical protein
MKINFEHEIIRNSNQLKKAIKFIHQNKFSLKTTSKKICNKFDNRPLGIIFKKQKKIVASIFYYYQPQINIKSKKHKVLNFGTIYVSSEYRGQGIPRIMIKKTLNLFKNYIITDYTPVGPIERLLKKMNFGYMKNYRYVIFPIPNLFSRGSIKKKHFTNKIQDLPKLQNYRKYDINLWQYERGKNKFMIGTVDRFHEKIIKKIKIRTKSTRILWTNNEKKISEELNNIAFLFYLKNNSKFISCDLGFKINSIFSFEVKNQFMMFPNLNIKIDTLGSEFFANNL